MRERDFVAKVTAGACSFRAAAAGRQACEPCLCPQPSCKPQAASSAPTSDPVCNETDTDNEQRQSQGQQSRLGGMGVTWRRVGHALRLDGRRGLWRTDSDGGDWNHHHRRALRVRLDLIDHDRFFKGLECLWRAPGDRMRAAPRKSREPVTRAAPASPQPLTTNA